MADDYLVYNYRNDNKIQKNKPHCGMASASVSSLGDICKLSESDDISAKQVKPVEW